MGQVIPFPKKKRFELRQFYGMAWFESCDRRYRDARLLSDDDADWLLSRHRAWARWMNRKGTACRAAQ